MEIITFVGPESSGKSDSGMLLAEKLNFAFVPEFARNWLLKNGPGYESSDLDLIAEGQVNLLEDVIKSQPKGIIVDSGILSLYMWAVIKYGYVSDIISRRNAMDPSTVYYLFRPTLPWQPDPLRENPAILDRSWIYNRYLEYLSVNKKKFLIIDPLFIK